METLNSAEIDRYAEIYSILDPYVASGLKAGANFVQSISKFRSESIPKSAFYSIKFDSISFSMVGLEDEFTLSPMPPIVDDTLGFAILERNNYDVTVYRVKSPEAISEKIWRLTCVGNDFEAYNAPPIIHSLNSSVYNSLLRSKFVEPELKAEIRTLHSELSKLEDAKCSVFDALEEQSGVPLKSVFVLLEEYVSELNSIHSLYHKRRNSIPIALDFWAGNDAIWDDRSKSLEIFDMLSTTDFAVHCMDNNLHEDYINLAYGYLKMSYETQHNLLFESPLKYLYAATRELEYAEYDVGSDISDLAKTAVDYDLLCSKLIFHANDLANSQNLVVGSHLYTFAKLRASAIGRAQKILDSLNKDANSNKYAYARRMLAIYIMRLSWTDPRRESKLLKELSFLSEDYPGFCKPKNYIQSCVKLNVKIKQFTGSILPKSSNGERKYYKKMRNKHLSNLTSISQKLRAMGADVFAVHADSHRKKLISHSQYKLGPQKYFGIADVFSPWLLLQSALAKKDIPSLKKLSSEIEERLSKVISLLDNIAPGGSSQVDDTFFAKNNPTVHCVDKFPPDAFPPKTQMAHHVPVNSDLKINLIPTPSGDPNFLSVEYKDENNVRFAFGVSDLRDAATQKMSVPRPDKRAVVYGPILFKEYVNNIMNKFCSDGSILGLFNYSRFRSNEKNRLSSRVQKANYALASYLSSVDYYRGCKFSVFVKNTDGKKYVLRELEVAPEILGNNSLFGGEPNSMLNLDLDSNFRHTSNMKIPDFPSSVSEILATNEAYVLERALKDDVVNSRLESYVRDVNSAASTILSDIAKSTMAKNSHAKKCSKQKLKL